MTKAPGKSRLRGAKLRSRQRMKAMTVGFGVAMAFTLALLSIVSTSPDPTATNGVDHVTRHLREFLTDQSTHGPADAAMEAQARRDQKPSPPDATAREAQARRDQKPNPPLAAVMEAQARRDQKPSIMTMESELRVAGTESITPAPAKAVTDSHARTTTTKSAMEALPPRHEERHDWEPSPDAIAHAEAKAEKAEEIALAALEAAMKAEKRAEAAEEAAEIAIIAQVGYMIEDARRGEQIAMFGETEDSDNSEDSKGSKDNVETVMGRRSW
ncbi:hypothetical protein PHYSODRAFT_335573 [Phytophthora sojae]|uniref:Uncharacterized protein n=1 Tax=Phytophthora sojae (strain P6497) TaxID=1094619 RepID=G4ZRP3_PHYSP|nr:hypothetical protein PHYSODRAFT_335573 [Phytophthora sojae]EGZ13852.1 hypothetical protein PHYSODRAFT_335573 [Phytophthora sojae]|eukprot:XP_009531281.1 hypothetical protein PHYSODRAFT_335573 [Phytophthora sojae]